MDANFLKVVKEIGGMLIAKKAKLSVAESCTGGFISNVITNLPGSSNFFDMSVISYSEKSKKSVLGIGGSLLKKYGTVSDEAAVAMAKGVKGLSKTDVALAITGVAGPERAEGKMVGLVFMAVAVRDEIESQGMKFNGGREEIKEQAAMESLLFLKRVLALWL